MRTKTRFIASLALIAAPLMVPPMALAQERPLSAIDWLETAAQTPPAPLPLNEPKTTGNGSIPTVTVVPLGAQAPVRIGLLPAAVSGLPDTLWSGSDAAALVTTLEQMPSLTLPAAQAVFFTLMLADAAPSSGESDLFDLARIDATLAAGALDPALAMLGHADPKRSTAHAARFVQASLLNETEAAACALLHSQPRLAPDYATRIFCTARAGDWDTAALMFGTARALGALSKAQTAALERFLDPDLFEGEPPLTRPAKPDPLLFRMHEALGQPITTHNWPVPYAHADLRDVAGWKKQLEAAERLARIGALGDNRLLGIYSQRKPAASGGIWDRVAAVQRFETALKTGSADAITKTLPEAWAQMTAANLAVPFATLFGEQLAKIDLTDTAQTTAQTTARDVILLSPYYETAKATAAPENQKFELAIAAGWDNPVPDQTQLENAIALAFSTTPPATPDITKLAQDGELGRAILRSLSALQFGADGDVAQLSVGLSALRALGLEDAARRAALQLLHREGQS